MTVTLLSHNDPIWRDRVDPDAAVTRAAALGATILQAATDKPHGLREAYILCANGYAWVPSRPLTD